MYDHSLAWCLRIGQLNVVMEMRQHNSPMKFSVCIRLKVHIHTSHIFGHGENIDVLLSCPSCAVLSMSVVRKTKGPFSVRDIAGIGTL